MNYSMRRSLLGILKANTNSDYTSVSISQHSLFSDVMHETIRSDYMKALLPGGLPVELNNTSAITNTKKRLFDMVDVLANVLASDHYKC